MDESYFMPNLLMAQGHSFQMFSDLLNDGKLELDASFVAARESTTLHIDIWKILDTGIYVSLSKSKLDHVVVVTVPAKESGSNPKPYNRYWFVNSSTNIIVNMFSKNYQLSECKNVEPSMCST